MIVFRENLANLLCLGKCDPLISVLAFLADQMAARDFNKKN